MRWICLLVAVPVMALPAQSPAPAWPVSPRPVTAIGNDNGDVDLEVDQVSSALRLPDGRVVIANGDPLELRVYDRAGRLERRIGRSGQGPGEFSQQVRVYRWTGDTVLSYTTGTRRWGLFAISGRLVREWDNPVRNTPADLMLYRQVFSIRGAATPAACVRALIDRIPPAREPGREVVGDGFNRFWVRDAGAADWTVYTQAGRAIGRVRLAPTAALLDVGTDAVVVRTRDANDVEHVEAWHVSMPAAPKPLADPCRQVADSSIHPAWGIVSAMLRTDLRNMQSAGDAYFKRHHTYPGNFADFGMTLSKPAQTDVRMLRSSEHGWGASVTDTPSGMYCIAFVGTLVAGWPSGTPVCADRDPPPPH